MKRNSFCPQEVFEARYLKVPQEDCLSTHPCSDTGQGEPAGTSSSSSDSESCSEAESSSEEVAMQLANLKERVRITPVNGLFSPLFLLFYGWFYSWKLSAISWADLPRCPQRNKRKAGWKGRKYPKKRILSQSTNHQNARLLLRKQSRQKALHCKCQCLYSMIILYIFIQVPLLICSSIYVCQVKAKKAITVGLFP